METWKEIEIEDSKYECKNCGCPQSCHRGYAGKYVQCCCENCIGYLWKYTKIEDLIRI